MNLRLGSVIVHASAIDGHFPVRCGVPGGSGSEPVQTFNQNIGKSCPSLRKSESLVTRVALYSMAMVAAKLSTLLSLYLALPLTGGTGHWVVLAVLRVLI